MGDITINKTQGGLGRVLPNEDHISGFIFYNDIIPNWLNKDIWVTGTVYAAKDVVYVSALKQYYICITAHTSGTFNTDIAKWDVYRKTVKNFRSFLDVTRAGVVFETGDWSYESYQLEEYFRIQPNGNIYVFIAPKPSELAGYDFSEIVELQNQSATKCKQIGIFCNDLDFAGAQLTAIQTQLDYLQSKFMPSVVIYTANFDTYTDVTTLPNLTALTASGVLVVLGQDGDAKGHTLSADNNGAVGAVLGATSLAKVNESIGWVDKFNLTNGTELYKPALANGTLVEDLSDSEVAGLIEKGYTLLIKRIGSTGTFVNDSMTAVVSTSDYSTIENNRTFNKAHRGIRKYLLPLLNSPLQTEPGGGGVLSPAAISTFDTATARVLFEMQRDAELTSYEVNTDPTQNVLATSQVKIDVRMLPYGTARDIIVSLGFDSNI